MGCPTVTTSSQDGGEVIDFPRKKNIKFLPNETTDVAQAKSTDIQYTKTKQIIPGVFWDLSLRKTIVKPINT